MWEFLENILPQLWFSFFGAIGAFIIEIYLLIIKNELAHIKLYIIKIVFGVIVGFILAYVLKSSDITQAFIIGIGWEAILSSMAKDSHFITSQDERVKRSLNKSDLPTNEDTLEITLEKMRKIGAKDIIPVVNKDGIIVGIVSDGDIERAKNRGKNLLKDKVSEIMRGSTGVVKVDENDSIAIAIKVAETQLIDRRPVKNLVVIDRKGIVKGLLTYDNLKVFDRPLFSK